MNTYVKVAVASVLAATADTSPLDRLYAIVKEAGIDISDSTEEDWPEYVAATVAPDEIVFALGPDDDETRTDLLAMCIALADMIASEGEALVGPGYVTAPDGWAVVLRDASLSRLRGLGVARAISPALSAGIPDQPRSGSASLQTNWPLTRMRETGLPAPKRQPGSRSLRSIVKPLCHEFTRRG
jgi:hypothetical protein